MLLIRLDLEVEVTGSDLFPGRALREPLRRALLPFSPTANGEVL